MRKLILVRIAVATLCALTLAALAVAHRVVRAPSDDVIIIKGGSMTVQCPPTQDKACLGVADPATGKYTAKAAANHITKVVVKNSNGDVVFDSDTLKAFGNKPEIDITYKAP